MPPINALIVKDVLGWKATDDKQHVLVGLQAADGSDFPVALAADSLGEFIQSLAHASDAFDDQQGADSKNVLAMPSNRFLFGKIDGSQDFFLRLHLSGGGHLTFAIDRMTAEQLTETLNVTVLGVATHPTPETPRN